ncbi:MAG: hypothetical protein B6D58_07700 [candidate division Zixibacteria bacterium 4484_95]|nr:MAG: hypothetical protein B6D58_07700 [candidate division Zixibacteria bacterium 4484_95]
MKGLQPLVSVITPLYNSEKYIGETIESVIGQTYHNWEMVIVDDCSTDSSADIVEKYSKKDPRIRLIKCEKNFGGPARPRNIGIKNAKGEYIAFLDSDDRWYPEKLFSVKRIFELYPDVDIVYHAELEVSLDGRKKILDYGQVKEPAYEDLLFRGNKLLTSATVVRRDVAIEVGGFSKNMDFNSVEDYDFWLKLARLGSKFYYLNHVLGEYYRGPESLTNKIEYHAQNAFNVYKSHLEQLRAEGKLTGSDFNKFLATREVQKLYNIGRRYHQVNSYQKSRRFFVRAIKRRPLWYKPYYGMLLTLMKIKR